MYFFMNLELFGNLLKSFVLSIYLIIRSRVISIFFVLMLVSHRIDNIVSWRVALLCLFLAFIVKRCLSCVDDFGQVHVSHWDRNLLHRCCACSTGAANCPASVTTDHNGDDSSCQCKDGVDREQCHKRKIKHISSTKNGLQLSIKEVLQKRFNSFKILGKNEYDPFNIFL